MPSTTQSTSVATIPTSADDLYSIADLLSENEALMARVELLERSNEEKDRRLVFLEDQNKALSDLGGLQAGLAGIRDSVKALDGEITRLRTMSAELTRERDEARAESRASKVLADRLYTMPIEKHEWDKAVSATMRDLSPAGDKARAGAAAPDRRRSSLSGVRDGSHAMDRGD